MDLDLKGLELDITHIVLELVLILDYFFQICIRHLYLDLNLNLILPMCSV